MPRVTIDNRILSVSAGTLLSGLLSDQSHPCGGKGVCGKCKVRVRGAVTPPTPTEQRHLSAIELADGIRLSCQTAVQGDCRVERLTTPEIAVVTAGQGSLRSINPTFAHYGVAVDIGTTTLAARLYSADGTLLAETGTPNPQIVFGADVLTRTETYLGGQADAITASVRQGVTALLRALTATASVDISLIEEMVITGNTVMLTLLIGGDASPFARAPFSGHMRFGTTLTAEEIGLVECPRARVYLTPCATAFIGGDVSAALTAVTLPDGALLLDIGTNGEMVLNANGTLYACSTAAGPAFEGVGISCGMVASPGAVYRVELVNGALYPHVIGGGKAVGVCGSGLVDALSCIALLGETDAPASLTPDVTITVEDIQALLTSKSAIRSGIDTLLHSADLTAEDVTALYIAGGFGRYLDVANGMRIGLLPTIPADRVHVVGNAALDGAVHLLMDENLRRRAKEKMDAIHPVDLAQNPFFARRFIHNMTLEVPR